MSDDARNESQGCTRSVSIGYAVSRTIGKTGGGDDSVGITPDELPEYIRSKSTPRIKELARKLKGATDPEQRQEAEAMLLLEIEVALRHCPEWLLARLLGEQEPDTQGEQP